MQKLVFQVYDFETWLTRMMFLWHSSRYRFGQLGAEGLMLAVPDKQKEFGADGFFNVTLCLLISSGTLLPFTVT